MYISTTVGFFVYGYFIYKNKFHARGIARSHHQGQLLRKIGLLGLICMVCFMVRACLTLLQIEFSVIETWWTTTLYYLILEIFPLTLMLIALITVNMEPKPRLATLNPTATTPLIA